LAHAISIFLDPTVCRNHGNNAAIGMCVCNVRPIRASTCAVLILFDPAIDYLKLKPHYCSPLFTLQPNAAPAVPTVVNKILMATIWQVPGCAHCMEFDSSWFREHRLLHVTDQHQIPPWLFAH
jgi:hypothetical protein